MNSFFVILCHFLLFDPPNNPKNQNFEKMKKNTWRYHFMLAYHKWSYDLWFLRYWAWQSSLLFCPFTPLTTWNQSKRRHLFWVIDQSKEQIVLKALELIEIITSKNDGPYPCKTKLGWCIVGPVRKEKGYMLQLDRCKTGRYKWSRKAPFPGQNYS